MMDNWMVKFRKNNAFLRSIGVNDLICADGDGLAFYGGTGCQDSIPVGRIREDESGPVAFELLDGEERSKLRLVNHIRTFEKYLNELPEELRSQWFTNGEKVSTFGSNPIELSKHASLITYAFNLARAALSGDWCEIPPRDTKSEALKHRTDAENTRVALVIEQAENQAAKERLSTMWSKVTELEAKVAQLEGELKASKEELTKPTGRISSEILPDVLISPGGEGGWYLTYRGEGFNVRTGLWAQVRDKNMTVFPEHESAAAYCRMQDELNKNEVKRGKCP